MKQTYILILIQSYTYTYKYHVCACIHRNVYRQCKIEDMKWYESQMNHLPITPPNEDGCSSTSLVTAALAHPWVLNSIPGPGDSDVSWHGLIDTTARLQLWVQYGSIPGEQSIAKQHESPTFAKAGLFHIAKCRGTFTCTSYVQLTRGTITAQKSKNKIMSRDSRQHRQPNPKIRWFEAMVYISQSDHVQDWKVVWVVSEACISRSKTPGCLQVWASGPGHVLHALGNLPRSAQYEGRQLLIPVPWNRNCPAWKRGKTVGLTNLSLCLRPNVQAQLS